MVKNEENFIWYALQSVLPFVEKRAKMLENKAVRYIKSHLALKHTLQIRFELDLGEQAREHIEKILNSS